jgi:hypothetical protein
MAQLKIRWAILVALFILELLTSITEGKNCGIANLQNNISEWKNIKA